MSQQARGWSIWPSVHLPSALYSIGEGAIAPVIAITAREMGASVATASFVVAALGIGRVVGDVPAGVIAQRFGERRTLLLAIALYLAALLLCIGAGTVWMLTIAVGFTGISSSAFGVARHAYLTDVTPYHMRGRALSTMGGMQRVGLFIGPFLGAASMTWLGTVGAYWVAIGAALLSGAALLAFPAPLEVGAAATPATGRGHGTAAILRAHLPVLRTLGIGAVLIGAVRASRQVAIPLWANHLGLDPATISVVFGLSGALDTLLFYPAGLAMDRLGRRAVVVSSMVVLCLGHLLLPLTHATATLAAVALVIGLGNGMSSGVLSTVGSDASPAVGRATFLGAWRLCGDVGNGVGPILIGAIAGAAALAPAVLAMGGVAAVSAAVMGRWIPGERPSGG
jgi:MFS family permease